MVAVAGGAGFGQPRANRKGRGAARRHEEARRGNKERGSGGLMSDYDELRAIRSKRGCEGPLRWRKPLVLEGAGDAWSRGRGAGMEESLERCGKAQMENAL